PGSRLTEPLAGQRNSPVEFVSYVPDRTTEPSPVGGQERIHQLPLWNGSAKKKCRWNVHTCGSFLMTGSVSVAPSWILTVPLLPGGAARATLADSANTAARPSTAPQTVRARPWAMPEVMRCLPFSVGRVRAQGKHADLRGRR